MTLPVGASVSISSTGTVSSPERANPAHATGSMELPAHRSPGCLAVVPQKAGCRFTVPSVLCWRVNGTEACELNERPLVRQPCWKCVETAERQEEEEEEMDGGRGRRRKVASRKSSQLMTDILWWFLCFYLKCVPVSEETVSCPAVCL